MIGKEIAAANAGKSAYIIFKINGLTERKMIKALYKASQAGVKVELIVGAEQELYLNDNTQAWELDASGKYNRLMPKHRHAKTAQQQLLENCEMVFICR